MRGIKNNGGKIFLSFCLLVILAALAAGGVWQFREVRLSLNSLNAETQAIRADLDALVSDTRVIRTDLEALTTDTESVQSDLGTLQTNAREIRADLNSVNAVIQGITRDLNSAIRDNSELRLSLNTLMSNLQTIDEELTTLTGEARMTREALDAELQRSREMLDSSQVYDLVSPAVAFIDASPYGTGSGLLIEDNYILTAWHVVTPANSVRVTFGNGEVYNRVPVVAVDSYRDLAIVGPVGTNIAPYTNRIASDSEISAGDAVFLIGYPAERESTPQAAITQGVISRFREWEGGGLTLLQVDATIRGGQSGGVLVSSEGKVVGISNYGQGNVVAVVNEITDVQPSIERLRAGQDVNGLGNRDYFNTSMNGSNFSVEFETPYETETFWLRGSIGDRVTVRVVAEGDVTLNVYDAYGGSHITTTRSNAGTNFNESFEIRHNGGYFIVVQSWFYGTPNFTLRTSQPVNRITTDSDDGKSLGIASSMLGQIDYTGDTDWYTMRLNSGQTVDLCVDSFVFDPWLAILPSESSSENSHRTNDDAFGYWDYSPHIRYTAPVSGNYTVAVESTGILSSTGGYEIFTGARCGSFASGG